MNEDRYEDCGICGERYSGDFIRQYLRHEFANGTRICSDCAALPLGTLALGARTARGLSQADAAAELKVSQATLSRWETGAMGIHDLRKRAVVDWIEGE